MKPRILALDLEGTLISNAVSQIPRPGLRAFIEFCLASFERVVIFTAVNRPRTEAIIDLLVKEGELPEEFDERWEFVVWDGPNKDLQFISGAHVDESFIVDDRVEYIHASQRDRWIEIAEFTGRETHDEELARVEADLRRKFEQ